MNVGAEWSDSLSGDGRLYAALEAKRMISVINLIAANGEMVCVCVIFKIKNRVYHVYHVSFAFVCVCALSVCVCVCIINAVAQCE